MPKIGNNCNLKKNAEKLLVILPKLGRFILGRMCVLRTSFLIVSQNRYHDGRCLVVRSFFS